MSGPRKDFYSSLSSKRKRKIQILKKRKRRKRQGFDLAEEKPLKHNNLNLTKCRIKGKIDNSF